MPVGRRLSRVAVSLFLPRNPIDEDPVRHDASSKREVDCEKQVERRSGQALDFRIIDDEGKLPGLLGRVERTRIGEKGDGETEPVQQNWPQTLIRCSAEPELLSFSLGSVERKPKTCIRR